MTYEGTHFNENVIKTMTREKFILHAAVGSPNLTHAQLGEVYDLVVPPAKVEPEKSVVTLPTKKEVIAPVTKQTLVPEVGAEKADEHADNS